MPSKKNSNAFYSKKLWKCPRELFLKVMELNELDLKDKQTLKDRLKNLQFEKITAKEDRVFLPGEMYGDYLIANELKGILEEIKTLEDVEDVDINGIRNAIEEFINDPERKRKVEEQKREVDVVRPMVTSLSEHDKKEYFFDYRRGRGLNLLRDLVHAELNADGTVNQEIHALGHDVLISSDAPIKKLQILREHLSNLPENELTEDRKKAIASIDNTIERLEYEKGLSEFTKGFESSYIWLEPDNLTAMYIISKSLDKDHPIMLLMDDLRNNVNKAHPELPFNRKKEPLFYHYYNMMEQMRNLIDKLPEDTEGKQKSLKLLNSFLQNEQMQQKAAHSKEYYYADVIYSNCTQEKLNNLGKAGRALALSKEGETVAFEEMVEGIIEFSKGKKPNPTFSYDKKFSNRAKELSKKICTYLDEKGPDAKDWKTCEAFDILKKVDPEKAYLYTKKGMTYEPSEETKIERKKAFDVIEEQDRIAKEEKAKEKASGKGKKESKKESKKKVVESKNKKKSEPRETKKSSKVVKTSFDKLVNDVTTKKEPEVTGINVINAENKPVFVQGPLNGKHIATPNLDDSNEYRWVSGLKQRAEDAKGHMNSSAYKSWFSSIEICTNIADKIEVARKAKTNVIPLNSFDSKTRKKIAGFAQDKMVSINDARSAFEAAWNDVVRGAKAYEKYKLEIEGYTRNPSVKPGHTLKIKSKEKFVLVDEVLGRKAHSTVKAKDNKTTLQL